MSGGSWITYAEAAVILGCHVSNVPKLVNKGELASHGGSRGALSRVEVEGLATRRAELREARLNRTVRSTYRRVDHRPDHEHEWLSIREVAELVGVTRPAIQGRIHRGRLPAVENGGRYWVRADHLELVERARLVQRTRRP